LTRLVMTAVMTVVVKMVATHLMVCHCHRRALDLVTVMDLVTVLDLVTVMDLVTVICPDPGSLTHDHGLAHYWHHQNQNQNQNQNH
jgi:hypothetical protein